MGVGWTFRRRAEKMKGEESPEEMGPVQNKQKETMKEQSLKQRQTEGIVQQLNRQNEQAEGDCNLDQERNMVKNHESGQMNEESRLQLQVPDKKENISAQQSGSGSVREQKASEILKEKEVTNVYAELAASEIPGVLAKEARAFQRKRTLILWLKQNPSQSNEKQRDQVLRKQGYEVYSSDQISKLRERFVSGEGLFLSVYLMFSFSVEGDSDLLIRQLMQGFIDNRLIRYLLIVKPVDISRYRLFLEGVKANARIVETSYQILAVIHELARLELMPLDICGFVKMRYWPERQLLWQVLGGDDEFESYAVRSKIALWTCLRVGRSVIQFARSTELFKRLLFQYSIFHDLYFEGSILLSRSSAKQNYLKRFAVGLLANPLSFYCEPTHQILISRLMQFNGDRLATMANVMLPVALIFQQIREHYAKQNEKKKYRNEFICFSELHLSEGELRAFQRGEVVENLVFWKARLKRRKTDQQSISTENVLLIISVTSQARCIEHENGYYFIEANANDQEGEERNSAYFQGYQYVIFNLLNSFKVMSNTFDPRLGKHVIEVQYAYVARQFWLKQVQNYIPDQQESIRYRKSQSMQDLPDYSSLIVAQSNLSICRQIEDFGDGYSLLLQHRQAIGYYQKLFKRNMSEMMQNSALLAFLSSKKGMNYQLVGNFKSGLEYYYNALNIFCKEREKEDQDRLYFSCDLENIHLSAMRVQLKQKEYEKVIRFGESMVKNANSRGGVSRHSKEFRLQFYRYMACSFAQLAMKGYQIKAEDPRVMFYFGEGLKMVQQMGEYSKSIPPFYLSFARWLLISRSVYDAVVYLSKSILILKSIFTEFDPVLCEYYLLLAIGCYSMHDYEQALKNINAGITLYEKHFGDQHYRLAACLEVKGKICHRLGKIRIAIDSFEKEKRILKRYRERRGASYSNFLQNSDEMGIFNRLQKSQRIHYFDAYFRQSWGEMREMYCSIFISCIRQQQFQYADSLVALSEALNESVTVLGEGNVLSIQILLLMSQAELRLLKNEAALESVKKAWKLIIKNKKEGKYETVRYFLTIAKIHQFNEQWSALQNDYAKARETAHKTVSEDTGHLQVCRIIDLLGMSSLKNNKPVQAARLFQQSEAIRQSLLKQTIFRRETISLFGFDFQDFITEIKIGLCCSIENQAVLQLYKKQIGDAKQLLRKCLSELIEVAGEYHLTTARVYHRLGALLFNSEGDRVESHTLLSSALSIYEVSKNSDQLVNLVDIYQLLSRIEQGNNQLGLALQHLVRCLQLLKGMSRGGKFYLRMLDEFQRLLQVILDHKNVNYLKNAYFLVSDLFQQEKLAQEDRKKGEEDSKGDKMVLKVGQLLDMLDKIGKAIEEIQPRKEEGGKLMKRERSPGARQFDLSLLKERLSENRRKRGSQSLRQ